MARQHDSPFRGVVSGAGCSVQSGVQTPALTEPSSPTHRSFEHLRQSGPAIPATTRNTETPACIAEVTSASTPQYSFWTGASDGGTKGSSRLAQEATGQRGPIPPVAIRHPPGMETVACHMVIGTRHRQFVFPHPMAVCLGNQHPVHSAFARGDEVELRTAVVSCEQGNS